VESDQPEERRGPGNSLVIVISPRHFAWLSKQCEILSTSKQELIANALREWLPRHSPAALGLGASAAVELALSDFIRRHGDEFIALDDSMS
jgi:hypothetical protein